VQVTEVDINRKLEFERLLIRGTPKWTLDQSVLNVNLINFLDEEMVSSSDRANVTFTNEVNESLTQKEILFSTYPEALLSLLFSEQLGVDEIMVMRGVRQFSNYTESSHGFKFTGFHDEQTPVDIILIDSNKNLEQQFTPQNLDREFNKLWKGFSAVDGIISTGHNSNQDPTLRFLQQLAVATVTGKKIDYLIKDEQFSSIFEYFLKEIETTKLTISQLFQMISKYQDRLNDGKLYQTFTDFMVETFRVKAGWGYDHLIIGAGIVLVTGFVWRVADMTKWATRGF